MRHLLLKTIGLTLFLTAFFVAYFHLLRYPAYAVTEMPVIWLDRVIPFQPYTLLLYVSLWVYVAIPVHLMTTRRAYFEFGAAYFFLCLAGLICFYFWPTEVPQRSIDWASYPGFDFLKRVDAAGNACPSLHVATAVFAGIWLERLLCRIGAPRWVRIGNLLWCIGITYSTLATRQHVALDALAGTAMGIIAGWMSRPLAPRLLADAAD